MLSNYSSFLELIAGVYFTMCLDNILTQKIWSVDYFAAFKKSLEELSFGGNKSIASEVVDQNRDLVSIMQAKLTKKSVYMLTYISIMLLACGVEVDQNPAADACGIYMFVDLQSLVTLITLCFSKYIFQKWSRTFNATFLPLALIFFLSNIDSIVNLYSYIAIPVIGIIHLVLFLVIYPILWQVFKVWAYKSQFYKYMNNTMIQVSNEYNNVLDILQNGGNINDLPEEYGRILQENTIKHKKDKAQKAIDDSITDYTALLQQKLKKIGYETSIWTVLWTNFIYKDEVLNQLSSNSPASPDDRDINELNNYKKK